MTLKKQSIRKNMRVIVDGKEVSKDKILKISEGWSEIQENFFRKMLQQGGIFTLKGKKYIIELSKSIDTRSDGSKDSGIIQIPGEDSKF